MSDLLFITAPPLAGTSSLIAASIVHAARLANQGKRLAPVRRRPQEPGEDSRWPRRACPLLRVRDADTEFWAEHEYRRIETAAQVDAYAQNLWNRWLAKDLRSHSRPVSDSCTSLAFGVTLVDKELIGMGEGDGPREYFRVIKAPGRLFHEFSVPRNEVLSPSRTLARHRLRTALRQADSVVICLPSAVPWSKATRMAVRRIVAESRALRPTGADIVVALTKSDIGLCERSLSECPLGSDPVGLVMGDVAEAMLRTDSHKSELWDALRAEPGIRLQVCSSYGLLCTSGSINVDLVAHTDLGSSMRDDFNVAPLWPNPSHLLSELLPSVPEKLEHWAPLGVLETVLGVGA